MPSFNYIYVLLVTNGPDNISNRIPFVSKITPPMLSF